MPLQKHRYQRTEPVEGGLHRLSRLQTFSFETRTNSTPIIGLDSILRLNHPNRSTESLDSLLERPFEEEAAEEGAAEESTDGNLKQDPNLVSSYPREMCRMAHTVCWAAFRQAANTSPLLRSPGTAHTTSRTLSTGLLAGSGRRPFWSPASPLSRRSRRPWSLRPSKI